MTFNQDSPNSTSPAARSHGLFWLVIAGAIVMVFLGVTIVALFFQSNFLGKLTSLVNQETEAINQPQSAEDQLTLLQNQQFETVTTTPDTAGEVVIPTATIAANYLLKPKQIVPGSPKERPRWTPTPLPTLTPTATPSPVPTFVGDNLYSNLLRPESVASGEKWIDVNLTSQTLVAFEGSAPVFQSLVSSGTAAHPTVTGQFRIWLRFSSQDMNGRRLGYDYFLKDVPYVQYFYQDYALHGTFWHNNFGTPMSHGCVNLPTPSAEWLFNWASNGTLVNIHN